jgi:antitoxin component YwqK of YwqJK toxin-antitoxin module
MRQRVLLILCALCLVLPALAQPTAGVQLNATDAKGRKQGSWSKAWPNGKTRYLGQFKDDKAVGTFKHYDADGGLITLQEHAGDGRTSRARHFHPNGALMANGKYLGQEKDSTWNYYGTDGKLRKVERFAQGKLEGEQVSYYPNGAMAETEIRKAGVLAGQSKSWFANGKLKSETVYQAGEPEGKMVFYFPSGKKEIEGTMVNGDRDGTWYYFNEDGTVQLQILYAKGQLVKERKENGTFKEYYDDEQLKTEVTYKKGKREGPFAEYHDNGRWEMKAMEADPVMGTPNDVERVLRGQTKKTTGTYVNDLLEGEVKEYDEKGKVLKVTRYVGGVAQ